MDEIVIPFIPVAILWFSIWMMWRVNWRKTSDIPSNWKRELVLNLGFLYVLAVLYFTLFKNGVMVIDFGIEKAWNMELLTDTLRMFNGNQRAVYIALYNVLGNILMFVPLGILMPMIWPSRSSLLKVAVYGAGISFLIENIQYFTSGNISDVDDVLFNTLGAIIGLGVYWVFNAVTTLWYKLSNRDRYRVIDY